MPKTPLKKKPASPKKAAAKKPAPKKSPTKKPVAKKSPAKKTSAAKTGAKSKPRTPKVKRIRDLICLQAGFSIGSCSYACL